MLRRLSAAYFAGAVAGLLVAVAVWIAGRAELTPLIGVDIAPSLSWDWLRERILSGSLWGLGYPLVSRRGFTTVRTGLVLSLFPTTLELLYSLPEAGSGLLGLELGALTPIFVLVKNGLWGFLVARVMARLVA